MSLRNRRKETKEQLVKANCSPLDQESKSGKNLKLPFKFLLSIGKYFKFYSYKT